MDAQLKYDEQIETEIAGLFWIPKRVIEDERGAVFLMLKDQQFNFPVGELYFSLTKPGKIKGWKNHRDMRQRFAVPVGQIKLVVVDQRTDSPSQGRIVELVTGRQNYGVIQLPAGVWYSFKCISDEPALVVNAASISHKDDEMESLSVQQFTAYRWPS